MVPSILVYLKELPLTINGKLDRRALPDPEFGSKDNYVAPRNEIEKKVCRIWSEVLGLAEDKIGIRDDFFRLGGDSIVSIQLVSRLRQRLELPVSIKDIFTYKNIERLYDNVLSKSIKANNKLVIKSEQGVLDGEVPLLPIQEWFFKSRFEYFNHWNQSFLLKTSALDLERLRDSIGRLIHHHDGFRLRYKKDQELQRAIDDLIVDNNCIQYYDSNAKIEELKVLDIRTLESQEGSRKFEIKLQNILTEWQSNFNIGEGPTYSVGYIYGYEDGSARVYFALHHLIVDAVSWRIIGEDLRNLYDGKDLGRKGSSYRQWINAVRDYEQAHRNEKEYWENILVDCNQKGLEELVVGQDTVYASLELDQEKTKELLQQSNRAYNTQVNDLLLTALGYALSEVSGNRTNHIVLEGHGREEIDSTIDITRTVGWFTTMYPVRLEIREELDFSIKNIKEMVRQVPNKGVGYGAIIGYKDKTILPKVSFNYLGQFDKEDREILEEYSDGEVNRLWVITNENSGISVDFRNQDYNIININGLVIEGSLQFSIASKLGQSITDKIAKSFKQKLEEIIAHCIHKNMIEYTMSDFNDFEPYVIFNKAVKDDYNKLFMFPAGGVGAESYFNNIVPKLQDMNLVLFNNYYSYLVSKFGVFQISHITYEKLANDYINYIKIIQPKGPYNLFGWSFGGVLAFEVARQLIDTGNTVANIILIDPFFYYKMAMLKTNTKLSAINNINYNYLPLINNSKNWDTNIIFFKTFKVSAFKTEILNQDEDTYSIYKYYAKNTKYNHLDDILGNKKFRMIIMDYTHNSWINSDSQVTRICDVIKKYL